MYSRIPKGAVVILEGIMDEKEYLGPGIPHKETRYGMPSQFGIFNPKVEANFKTYNADIDLSWLTPEMRQAEIDRDNRDIGDWADASKKDKARWTKEYDAFKNIRNERLLASIRKGLEHYQHIVVTWGGGHNSFVASELKKDGFTLRSREEVKAISFW